MNNEIAEEQIWKKWRYFGQLSSDFNLEKVNFPENALIYINQVYLTVQKSKRIYYAEYVLLGQIHESSMPPSNIKNYVCEKDEVKYFRPRYDRETGKFLGIYETVGFLLVRGDPNEVFLSRKYDSKKSRILYSSFKKKIPNSFSSTLFNQHIKLIESTDNTDMSQLFFFLPSIANEKESLNENLTLLNVEKKELDTLCG